MVVLPKAPLLFKEGWQPLRLTGWWECDTPINDPALTQAQGHRLPDKTCEGTKIAETARRHTYCLLLTAYCLLLIAYCSFRQLEKMILGYAAHCAAL